MIINQEDLIVVNNLFSIFCSKSFEKDYNNKCMFDADWEKYLSEKINLLMGVNTNKYEGNKIENNLLSFVKKEDEGKVILLLKGVLDYCKSQKEPFYDSDYDYSKIISLIDKF